MSTYTRALADYTRQFLNPPPDPRTDALRRIAAMPSEHDFARFGYSGLAAAMAQVARAALGEKE